MVGFGFAVVTNFASYWFSDKIVLAMYGAQEVGPDHPLSQIVSRPGRSAPELPQPRCYVIPSASPNAFATGRNPRTPRWRRPKASCRCSTSGSWKACSAHELAHVKHRDILISSVAATLAAAIMMVARMAQFAAFFGGGRRRSRGAAIRWRCSPTIILAPLAAMLIQAAISRSREYAADAGGAADRGQSVRAGRRAAEDRRGVEAGAARRQPRDGAHVHHQAVLGQGLLSLFSTHPPTEKRIQALLHLA